MAKWPKRFNENQTAEMFDRLSEIGVPDSIFPLLDAIESEMMAGKCLVVARTKAGFVVWVVGLDLSTIKS